MTTVRPGAKRERTSRPSTLLMAPSLTMYEWDRVRVAQAKTPLQPDRCGNCQFRAYPVNPIATGPP